MDLIKYGVPRPYRLVTNPMNFLYSTTSKSAINKFEIYKISHKADSIDDFLTIRIEFDSSVTGLTDLILEYYDRDYNDDLLFIRD